MTADEFLKNKGITKATCYTDGGGTYYLVDLIELIELYAEAKAREAFDAARELQHHYSKGLYLYDNYETYKKHHP